MTRTATSSNQLMRILATPSRVASILDWKKSIGAATIATINIDTDRIGVQISHHPQQQPKHPPQAVSVLTQLSSPATKLVPSRQRSSLSTLYRSFPVSSKGRSKIPPSTRRGLSDLIHRHGVCGFVVSWPLQEDTGRMGAACGRTLFAIEELLKEGTNHDENGDDSENPPVFVPDRPICLWDRTHHNVPATDDAFGRSPSYARAATPEQIHPEKLPKPTTPTTIVNSDSSSSFIVSSRVWDDFVRVHWPDPDRDHKKHHL